MTEKVKVRNLVKHFDKLEVLNGIDLTVTEGEVVCIIGPSGSGKSTLLRCLNKLEEPTGGEIIIDDAVVTDKKTNINKVRENIGMVFQSFNLFSNFTVLQNIMFAPVELKKMTKTEAKTKAMELLSARRTCRQGGCLPASAVGRSAAARCHRAVAGDESRHYAL